MHRNNRAINDRLWPLLFHGMRPKRIKSSDGRVYRVDENGTMWHEDKYNARKESAND